jgi:hypothetical protein
MGFLRAQLNPLLEGVLGLALFTLLSVTAAVATRQTPYQTSVPLLFIVLAALVAFFIGKRAAYMGLIAAAVVFAVVLFKPLGSWHVDEQGVWRRDRRALSLTKSASSPLYKSLRPFTTSLRKSDLELCLIK